MTKNYAVTVDEKCDKHGGLNFSYQYDDENFVRIESACEGCNVLERHSVSSEVQASREARAYRPERHTPSSGLQAERKRR